jgi:hypothetical protein
MTAGKGIYLQSGVEDWQSRRGRNVSRQSFPKNSTDDRKRPATDRGETMEPMEPDYEPVQR